MHLTSSTFLLCLLFVSFCAQDKCKLKSMMDYKCLNNVRINGINDAEEFKKTKDKLNLLGFTADDCDMIFTILSAVLELGNVDFEGGNENAHLSGDSQKSVKAVEELLSLPTSSLSAGLLQKAIGTARGKTTTVEAKVEDAIQSRDGLAKALYSKVFDFVVKKINAKLEVTGRASMQRARNFGKTPKGEPLYIGIVDQFGYESNQSEKGNSFEQLVINYVGEKIRQQVTKSLFKDRLSQYKEESIGYPNYPHTKIKHHDNIEVVEMLDKKPQGLLCMLDEACRYPRNTDKTFLQKLTSTHMRHTSANRVYNRDNTADDLTFSIKNTFKETTYTCKSFLRVNKDKLGNHLSELLGKSANEKYADVLTSLPKGQGNSGHATRPGLAYSNSSTTTFSKKVKEDMESICGDLSQCAIWSLICLKMNDKKEKDCVDVKLFENQVIKQDILSHIKMAQEGFEYSSVFQAFYDRFIIAIPRDPSVDLALIPNEGSNYKVLCEKLVNELAKLAKIKHSEVTILYGQKSIFIKWDTITAFEELRTEKLQTMDTAATQLQGLFRMTLGIRKYGQFRKTVCLTQALWRALFQLKRFRKMKEKAEILQRFAKQYLARKKFVHNLLAYRTIKKFCILMKRRIKWRKLRRGVVSLHDLARAYIVREHINRMLGAVHVLQYWARRFLKQNMVHYRKVHVALFFQSFHRGQRERNEMKEALTYLANRRKDRFRARAVRRAQSRWKALLIRRRFKQLVQAALTLQWFVRTRQQHNRFLSIKKAVICLQSLFRAGKDRDSIKEVWNEKLLRDERDASAAANRNEAKNLWKLNSKRAEGLAKGKSRTFRYDLLDVDILVAMNNVYAEGWSKNVIALDRKVAKRGRRITKVLVGSTHTVALADTGELHTWGWSDCGQLGHGSHNKEMKPRPLETLMLQPQLLDQVAIDRSITGKMSIKQVAVGEDHTLALADTGKVFSWGSGKKGQLGHGNFKNSSYPRCIQFLKWRTVSIVCGASHSVSIGHNGSLYTWGLKIACGGVSPPQDSTNEAGDISIPANMKDVVKANEKGGCTKIKKVCCGAKFSLGLTYDGNIYSWGDNEFGQLGGERADGNGKPRIIEGFPSLVKKLYHADIVDVSCGFRHSIAVNSRGQVFTWGWNEYGTLGNGNTDVFEKGVYHVSTLSQSSELEAQKIVQVSAGYRHSAALTSEGEIFVWGKSALGPRDGKGIPFIPTAENSMLPEAAQRTHVVPVKIYRAGQNVTKAIKLHSSWSRCTSCLSVTITKKTPELPRQKDGSVNWNAYLLKKVNVIIANGGVPERNSDLKDENKEFVLKLVKPDGRENREMATTASPQVKVNPTKHPKNIGPIGRRFSYTITGISPEKSPKVSLGRQFSYTSDPSNGTALVGGVVAKLLKKTTIISERELRDVKLNDLRIFARQLQNGEVKAAPRVEAKLRRGGDTMLTVAERHQNFFRQKFRDNASECRDLERESGWNANYSKNELSSSEKVKRAYDVEKELRRRQEDEKKLKELSILHKKDPKKIEEDKRRNEEKQKLIAENRRRRIIENTKRRRCKQGSGKVKAGDMLKLFDKEHLVAASNENYTSNQVRDIYSEHKNTDDANSSNIDNSNRKKSLADVWRSPDRKKTMQATTCKPMVLK